jgi:hypothetical protein
LIVLLWRLSSVIGPTRHLLRLREGGRCRSKADITNDYEYAPKLVARGEVDETMLEALEDYVKAPEEAPLSGWHGTGGNQRKNATAIFP